MKLLKKDLRKGVTLIVQTLDDLWYLSQVIEAGDLVKGKTLRKIKISEEGVRKTKTERKAVFMKLRVEKLEFHEYANVLRVSGTIAEGPEEIAKGAYHTFNLEEGSKITLIKEKWLAYQLERLKEASSKKPPQILICLLDRETAIFALMKAQGYRFLTELQGQVEKKGVKVRTTNFYKEVIKVMKEYVERYNIEYIILASPAFWKEYLLKELKDEEIKKKIKSASCSSVTRSAIDEVLKRSELKQVLKQDRIAKETQLVEELLVEISKKGPAAYGLEETKKASEAGAVKTLLITDKFIKNKRIKKAFEEIDNLMKFVNSMKAEIAIISSEHQAGKKLDGLGGIGALLRYKLR